MSRVKLSTNFFLDEFTRSQTATRNCIDNRVELGSTIHDNLRALCQGLLQPVRDGIEATYISSGYRSPELNRHKDIGGSTTSNHCYGTTADFVVTGFTPYEVCQWIVQHDLPYDQIIHEFGEWTHITICLSGMPRLEQLTAYKADGETVYINGIHSMESLL